MNIPLVSAYLFAMFAWVPLQLTRVSNRHRIDPNRIRNASVLSFALLAYECYMRFIWSPTVVAPIRIDILILLPISACVSIYYAVQNWRDVKPRESYEARLSGGRWTSIFLITIPILTLIGSLIQGHHSNNTTQQLLDQDRFAYEMSFRDEQTVRRFYGEVNSKESQWIGYFKNDQLNAAWSEIIINNEGHFWIFRGNHSKHEGELESLDKTHRVGHLSNGPTPGNRIEIQLSIDGNLELKEFLTSGNLLSITTMYPAVVPSFPKPETAKKEVEFVGTFTVKFDDNGKDFALETIWLWRSQDVYWGRHERQRYARGQTSFFNNPNLIQAECIEDCKKKPALRFRTDFGNAILSQQDQDHWQLRYASNPQEPIRVLQRGRYGVDYGLDLATLDTTEKNQYWISCMTLSYHKVWKIPEAIELSAF